MNQNNQSRWPMNNQGANNRIDGVSIVYNDNEVMQYPVAPGSTMMFVNFQLSEFYLKSVDPFRNVLPIRVFKFSEEFEEQTINQPQPISQTQIVDQQMVTRDEFNNLVNQMSIMQKALADTNKMLDDLTAPTNKS